MCDGSGQPMLGWWDDEAEDDRPPRDDSQKALRVAKQLTEGVLARATSPIPYDLMRLLMSFDLNQLESVSILFSRHLSRLCRLFPACAVSGTFSMPGTTNPSTWAKIQEVHSPLVTDCCLATLRPPQGASSLASGGLNAGCLGRWQRVALGPKRRQGDLGPRGLALS